MKKNRCPVIFIVFFIIVLIIGCVDKNNSNEIEEVEKFDVFKGGCISENAGYSIVNFDDDTEIISSENYITNYNLETNNYLFIKDSKFYIQTDNKYIELNEKNILNPQFSKDGQYLLYFTKEDYLTPNIYSTRENKILELTLSSAISGTYACWLNDNTLAYYGFNYEDNKGGIYTYDINTKEETLKYEVSGGYISFIKAIDDGIVFFVENYNDTTELILLKNQGDFQILSENVDKIYDLESLNGSIYLLGKMKNDVYSLFKITSTEVSRLIFNFPVYIHFEKGISITDDNEILFIGNNDGSSDDNVYCYSNNTISLKDSKLNDYTFIKVN